MDYQAGKAQQQNRKIVIICIILLSMFVLSKQQLLSLTITDSQTVSVSALVKDPNATSTNENATSSSSGGGGSFSSFVSPDDIRSIVISGIYAPGIEISVLSAGNSIGSTIVDPSGRFVLGLKGLVPGVYSLLLVATDPAYKDKQHSVTLSYAVYVNGSTETAISDVIFPPIFSPIKTSFKLGTPLEVYGKALPFSSVAVALDGKKVGTATASQEGLFSFTFSQNLKVGKHNLQYSYASLKSNSLPGRIETVTIYAQTAKEITSKSVCASRVDFSLDCRVNIVDFSILAYWYKRVYFPLKYDLNADGKIDIKDFSIMAYHWTG